MPGTTTKIDWSTLPRAAPDCMQRWVNLKKVYEVLEDREHAAKILVLRLAVILNHARRDIARPHSSLKFGKEIEFGIEAGWLARHPLTHYLLEEEAMHWARVGVPFLIRAL